jgi:transposase
VFAFVGRRRDRIKFIYWDRGGFVLVYKRLEKGRFKLPSVSPTDTSVKLDGASLSMLLDGIDLSSVRRMSAWTPARAAHTNSPPKNTSISIA